MTPSGRSSVVTNLSDSGSPGMVALTLCIVYCAIRAAFVVLATYAVVLNADMPAEQP